MDVKRILVVLALVALVTSMAGCLGGGDDGGGSTRRASTAQGATNVTGEALLEDMVMNPTELTETVNIQLEDSDITFISFNITVIDQAGAENTNKPDVVNSITISEGGDGNYEATDSGGQTTYEKKMMIEWDEKNLMGSEWSVTISVTCNPDDDGWPGPLIYEGYQDQGFKYSIEVSYEYKT